MTTLGPLRFDPPLDKTTLFVSEADKELAFLELDDLALGRFARSYLIECQRVWKKHAGDREMPLSIIASMHGALALIRIAHEVNAETYTLTNDRVTIAAQPLGDWRITIKQIRPPASGMEAEGQDRNGPDAKHDTPAREAGDAQ